MPRKTAPKYTGPPETHTPPRSFRVDGPLWEAGKLAAATCGLTVSDVLVRALAQYVLDRLDSDDLGDIDRATLEGFTPETELKRIITHINSKPQLVPTAL